ncbi:hypothetical protein [Maribellus maritimus]|uniref:hypothetical protein n=1 Tax=Maribellus maritimus TaxID=2870838 RepID=UPI001EEB67DA|nr:hypothetical protein [Maribellus maritimus]MCG6187665.1 hypothetical protein [Maribellus maritimus]
MKKALALFIVFGFACLFTSCPGDFSTTYNTIKSANVLLFSFNENGIFPHLETININELGIGVYPDSIFERYEVAQSNSIINGAYAMENPHQIVYTNSIDSINVFTIYEFNKEHPAGSKVNDILLFLDYMGETKELNINELSPESHHFKFSAVPTNDSLQFEITGRITNENDFKL